MGSGHKDESVRETRRINKSLARVWRSVYSGRVIREVVPLRYGTAFKKAFSDPEVFSAFVRDVVGVELEFTHIEQEKAFLAPVGKVDIRFDLFGEDVKHRAIVELQHVREVEMFARFNHYHMAAQIEQVRSHKVYTPERTVYTIVVLTRLPDDEALRFDVASQSSDLVTLDGRALGLFRHKLVFLNPRCIRPTTPAPIRRWLELIEDSLDEQIDESVYPNPLFQRIIKAIESDRLNPTERYWFFEEAIWEDSKSASYKEGIREGHKEGLQEGLRRGILDLCEVLGIVAQDERQRYLESLDAPGLEAFRDRLKQEKRWPDADGRSSVAFDR